MAARLPISWHHVKHAPFTFRAAVCGIRGGTFRGLLEPHPGPDQMWTVKNREFNDIMGDSMAQKLDLYNHDLTMEKMEISWDIHGDLMDMIKYG